MMKPIEGSHKHDSRSDSNISRPISVAHGRVPIDIPVDSGQTGSGSSRNRTQSSDTPHSIRLAQTMLEGDEEDDDVIRTRTSRFISL